MDHLFLIFFYGYFIMVGYTEIGQIEGDIYVEIKKLISTKNNLQT